MKDIFQNYTAEDNLKKSVERGEVILVKKETEDTKSSTNINVVEKDDTSKEVLDSTPTTNKTEDMAKKVENLLSERSDDEIPKDILYMVKGNQLI